MRWTAVAQLAMASRVSSPTFVGRRDELDRVAAVLAEVRTGQPRVVVVGGEAGVGKTRFAREFEHLAVSTGVLVLEGGCLPLGGDSIPYGAVIEALRSLPQTIDVDDLAAMAGWGHAELARLIPEFGPVAEPAQANPDGSGQGRLFEHVLRFLGQLGRRGPLAIVLEDIHWADGSTLELIGFLARNLRSEPVMLLATYRSDELHGRPLRPLLAELERSGRVELLALAPFDRQELASQLEGILGLPAEPATLARIAARSEGNAFYAEELLAAGSVHGELPATLREVLLARVARLAEPTRELVRVASAAGQRIASARLASVTGSSETHLELLLREAVANQVLVVQGALEGPRLTFRHALVQEAVYGELLPSERIRLHAAFARAISDEQPAQADPSSAAELAYNWQAAHDLPRAFDAWIAAGLAAETIYATSEAQASFEHALELWDQVPDAAVRAPLDRIALLMRAAFHAEGPDPTQAVAYIRQAIALVDPEVHPARAGLLRERLGQYGSSVLGPADILAAMREAVRLVPAEPPSAARSLVLSGLARCYVSGINRPAEAMALADEAVAVARAAGAKGAEARALVPLGAARLMLGNIEDGLATLRRAHELAAEIGDVHEAAGALTWLVAALYDAGRYAEAAATGLEAEAYAVRHGLAARWATNAIFWMVWALGDLGRWDEAAAALTRVQTYELSGPRELVLEAALLFLAVDRGQIEEADRRARRVRLLAERFPAELSTPLALAAFAHSQDDPIAARAALLGVDVGPDVPPNPLGWTIVSAIRAEADLAILARSRHAEVDLAEARARGGAFIARMKKAFEDAANGGANPTPLLVAQLATCEAEFSRLEGLPDPDRWASAAAAWAAMQMPHDRGYALMREGEAALAGNRDRRRATRALTEALEIATRLGAVPLRRATEKLAATAGIRLEPPERRERLEPALLDLTRREREVLTLLAAGRSNSEIGEILYVSRKTVSVHVANIKAKLGASTRVEMAIYAIESGVAAR